MQTLSWHIDGMQSEGCVGRIHDLLVGEPEMWARLRQMIERVGPEVRGG